jgi:hypothetical protein
VLILAAACSGDDPTTGERPGIVDTAPTDTTTSTVGGLRGELVAGHESIVRVSWTQDTDATARVEFGFDGETRTSPERALAAGAHDELLLGIPYATDVTFRVVTGDEVSLDAHLRTGPLPPEIPIGALEASDPAEFDAATEYLVLSIDESGGYFLSARWWTLIVDRQGRIVWGHRSPSGRSTIHPRVSADGGSLLLDHNSFWGVFDGGQDSEVVGLQLDGTQVAQWDTPGLHHAFTQLPDGTLVYGSYLGGHGSYDEQIVALPPEGGSEVLFDCIGWLAGIGEAGAECGSNTLSYDAASNRLMVSWFTLDAMTELDLDTREVVRWFGQLGGSYAFSPPGATFWYQHGGHFTEAGTLLLSTHVTEDDVELVVREYEIDDATRELRQVWTVGEGQGVGGRQMGEAHRLPGGNTLHNFGTNAHLREYTPSGEVVWEMDWAEEHTIGRSAPLTSDLWSLAPPRQ